LIVAAALTLALTLLHMTNVTLAILAGGAGSRMGAPKAELRVGEEPILAYLLRRFAWDGPTMLVTAPGRERPTGHELLAREVVDPVPGQGPLRGVLTALENAATDVVIIATVDMPGVGGEQLRWLVGELSRRADALGVMTRRGEAVEPFPCAMRRDGRDALAREIAADRRSVRRLCERSEFVAVDAPREWGERVWANLNRPEDLEGFARML
jgi:molybdenum cofactor guanylyltransferase